MNGRAIMWVWTVILGFMLILAPIAGNAGGTAYDSVSLEQLVAKSPLIVVVSDKKTVSVEMEGGDGTAHADDPFVTDVHEFMLIEVLKNHDWNGNSPPIPSRLKVHEAFWRTRWGIHRAFVERGVSRWVKFDRYRHGIIKRNEPRIIFLRRPNMDDAVPFELAVDDAYESIERRADVQKLINIEKCCVSGTE